MKSEPIRDTVAAIAQLWELGNTKENGAWWDALPMDSLERPLNSGSPIKHPLSYAPQKGILDLD